MKIAVLGMDPSLRHWGLAAAELDLVTGYLSTPVLSIAEPKDETSKTVRKNSKDLQVAESLASLVLPAARKAHAIFVEVPVGSQSARAMASYGVCVGVLGTIRALGIPLIEVTAKEVKVALSGDPNASKELMIHHAVNRYPGANFPMYKGNVSAKAEHVADAIGTIHAGVNTPVFQNLMRLLQEK